MLINQGKTVGGADCRQGSTTDDAGLGLYGADAACSIQLASRSSGSNPAVAIS
jgi:hypothetical protein